MHRKFSPKKDQTTKFDEPLIEMFTNKHLSAKILELEGVRKVRNGLLKTFLIAGSISLLIDFAQTPVSLLNWIKNLASFAGGTTLVMACGFEVVMNGQIKDLAENVQPDDEGNNL